MAQPVAQRRPGVVTAAAATMIVVAAAGLASVIGLLVAAAQFNDRYRPLAVATDARLADINDVGDAIRSVMGTLAIATFLAAVAFAVLAVGVLRRSNALRITTWVLIAGGLLCGCSQGISAITAGTTITYNGDPERLDVASQLTAAVQDALPGWLSALLGTVAVVQVIGYILVAILLGLPPANAYFRRTPRTVAAPTPAPGGTPWPTPTPYPPTPYPQAPPPMTQQPYPPPELADPPTQLLPPDPLAPPPSMTQSPPPYPSKPPDAPSR